jgi:4-hydroxybenzoate polyprenyltransferase
MNRQSTVAALLQLVRLPNVFTALADVAMGFLLTQGSLHPLAVFALLAATSCSLYLAGMVLNDVFDAEVDARERPARPIPSGRVPLRTATALGWGLLVSSLLFGWCAGYLAGDWGPAIIATLLAACVVLYDRTLKRTPIAPLLMGGCRMLNVLLGMSLSATAWAAAEWSIAAGIGVYIVGVTLFARTEARATSRGRLLAGTLVMLAGMVIVAAAPFSSDLADATRLVIRDRDWLFFWAMLVLLIGWRCVAAIVEPRPSRVQAAVRNAVQSIIVLDAAVCVGFVGPTWGIAILVLLVPTFMLTQWLKAT